MKADYICGITDVWSSSGRMFPETQVCSKAEWRQTPLQGSFKFSRTTKKHFQCLPETKPRLCAKPSHRSGLSANSTLLQTPAKWRQDGHAQHRTSRRQRQGCDESDSRTAAATIQRAWKKKCAKSMSKTVPTNSSTPKFTRCSVNPLDKNFEWQLCK